MNTMGTCPWIQWVLVHEYNGYLSMNTMGTLVHEYKDRNVFPNIIQPCGWSLCLWWVINWLSGLYQSKNLALIYRFYTKLVLFVSIIQWEEPKAKAKWLQLSHRGLWYVICRIKWQQYPSTSPLHLTQHGSKAHIEKAGKYLTIFGKSWLFFHKPCFATSSRL